MSHVGSGKLYSALWFLSKCGGGLQPRVGYPTIRLKIRADIAPNDCGIFL